MYIYAYTFIYVYIYTCIIYILTQTSRGTGPSSSNFQHASRHLIVVGSHERLGAWDPEKAAPCETEWWEMLFCFLGDPLKMDKIYVVNMWLIND